MKGGERFHHGFDFIFHVNLFNGLLTFDSFVFSYYYFFRFNRIARTMPLKFKFIKSRARII